LRDAPPGRRANRVGQNGDQISHSLVGLHQWVLAPIPHR
jgi:hypothetical protein